MPNDDDGFAVIDQWVQGGTLNQEGTLFVNIEGKHDDVSIDTSALQHFFFSQENFLLMENWFTNSTLLLLVPL